MMLALRDMREPKVERTLESSSLISSSSLAKGRRVPLVLSKFGASALARSSGAPKTNLVRENVAKVLASPLAPNSRARTAHDLSGVGERRAQVCSTVCCMDAMCVCYCESQCALSSALAHSAHTYCKRVYFCVCRTDATQARCVRVSVCVIRAYCV